MGKYTKPQELYTVLAKLYSEEVAQAITAQLRTDFTAGRMLGYLRQMSYLAEKESDDVDEYDKERRRPSYPPRLQDLVDEMLIILELRDAIVEKKIEENRRKKRQHAMEETGEPEVEELYLREFRIDWTEELEESYVGQIPAIACLESFTFTSNITFLVGENGSGKSTLLEAIAIALGLNPEGGTSNYNFSTYDDYSSLGSYMKLIRGAVRPKRSFFLRAESFYNVASAMMRKYNDDGRMSDLHARSHGESFMDFILRADEPGLYLLDEPEAALSPQRQLTLLIHLMQMARRGAQYIIVTHSPILLGIPDADIWSLDEGMIEQIAYEDTESYQVTKLFLENREEMIRRLMDTEE